MICYGIRVGGNATYAIISDWVLATGFWNDNALWKDDQFWID